MIKAVLFDMYETLVSQYRCPQYFSAEMARDAGVDLAEFRKLWYPAEVGGYMTGEADYKETVAEVLSHFGIREEALLDRMAEKNRAFKRAAFEHIHEGILPLLSELSNRGIRIGLVSNCYVEEAAVIRSSVLFPYFDAVCLSCELGIKKPDPAIFLACAEELGVFPSECLFTGDGGSEELPAAKSLGMTAVQAFWYLSEQDPAAGRIEDFPCAVSPECILQFLRF